MGNIITIQKGKKRIFAKSNLEYSMKKLLFISVILSMYAHLYAQSYNTYNVEKTKDEFDGFTIERMYGNYIPDSGWFPSNSLMFNAQRFTDKDGKQKYQFYVEWNDSEWLFIEEGEKLVLLIDGERISCNGYGSRDHRKTIIGSAIQETAIFDASLDIFKKIGNAKSVKLKLVGASKDIVRELDEEHIENYKKFVEELTMK